MNSRAHGTLAHLLLSAALSLSCAIAVLATSGCDSMHRKPVSAAPPPEAPQLSQTPLYSPEMSEKTPRLPTLPVATNTAVVEPPPPPEKKPRRVKKVSKPATPTTAKASGSPSPDTAAPATAAPAASNESAPTTVAAADHKPLPQQASAAVASPATTASPIGDLTAGNSADAAQTNQQTEELIKNTRNGLNNIKRALSADEKKTLAESFSFLDRAQQALKNGDGDGAFGLATKAKLLLDELTQK